ncbi:MAG: hypothetical protein CMJ39_00995 [Phycisphaerae bacterium]|nr:hypothetical protein [Phycisphaerae bacterium]
MRRIFLLPIAALLLGATGLAHGQADDADGGDVSHRDMNALETVNNIAGDKLEKTNKRISQMQDFLKEKNELQEFRTGEGGHGDTNNDGKVDRTDLSWNLSFDQALSMAKQHDAAVSHLQSTETPEERRVAAYRKVVKSTWEDLHHKMAEVNAMSEFMHEKGQFNEYQQWARQKNAEANKALIEDRAQKSKEAIDRQAQQHRTAEEALKAEQEQQKKQHEQFVKNSWQQYKFNQEQYTKRLKYTDKYRNGYWNNYSDGYGDVGWGGGWGGGW